MARDAREAAVLRWLAAEVRRLRRDVDRFGTVAEQEVQMEQQVEPAAERDAQRGDADAVGGAASTPPERAEVPPEEAATAVAIDARCGDADAVGGAASTRAPAGVILAPAVSQTAAPAKERSARWPRQRRRRVATAEVHPQAAAVDARCGDAEGGAASNPPPIDAQRGDADAIGGAASSLAPAVSRPAVLARDLDFDDFDDSASSAWDDEGSESASTPNRPPPILGDQFDFHQLHQGPGADDFEAALERQLARAGGGDDEYVRTVNIGGGLTVTVVLYTPCRPPPPLFEGSDSNDFHLLAQAIADEDDTNGDLLPAWLRQVDGYVEQTWPEPPRLTPAQRHHTLRAFRKALVRECMKAFSEVGARRDYIAFTSRLNIPA